MISIGSIAPDFNQIAPIKGTVPINATWDQYIPIVDEDGVRLSLTDYSFELAFRLRNSTTVDLRLSTVTGEILKTSDTGGDTLRIFVAPSAMADMDGDYQCSFAAKNTSDQVWLLAKGLVSFINEPAAFA